MTAQEIEAIRNKVAARSAGQDDELGDVLAGTDYDIIVEEADETEVA